MKSEFKHLLTVREDIEAEIIRGILETKSITVRLTGEVPHTVYPLTVDGLGEVRISVPTSEYDNARDALAEARRIGKEVPEYEEDEEE